MAYARVETSSPVLRASPLSPASGPLLPPWSPANDAYPSWPPLATTHLPANSLLSSSTGDPLSIYNQPDDGVFAFNVTSRNSPRASTAHGPPLQRPSPYLLPDESRPAFDDVGLQSSITTKIGNDSLSTVPTPYSRPGPRAEPVRQDLPRLSLFLSSPSLCSSPISSQSFYLPPGQPLDRISPKIVSPVGRWPEVEPFSQPGPNASGGGRGDGDVYGDPLKVIFPQAAPNLIDEHVRHQVGYHVSS